MLRLPRFIRKFAARGRCRKGEHERSGSRVRQVPEGWETVCRYCGVTLRRRDRLERWRSAE